MKIILKTSLPGVDDVFLCDLSFVACQMASQTSASQKWTCIYF